ncbi:phage holin family protein [Leptolyngbya sp. AN02str]|uniref:phage holin family protein n=1 Tax=Leptolyngbya sp. AN02str TaxID=3423363 RepID=UPI003D3241A6
MLGYLLNPLITALSLLIVDLVVPGVNIANFPAAIVAALVIGLINTFVKPALNLLSLPINFLTLGLFSFVINGLCFWLAAVLVPGFMVQGFLAFFVGPVVLSLATTLINNYFVSRNPNAQLAGSNSPTVNTPSRTPSETPVDNV